MARIKKIFNGTTFELTTPKSGNSLLNEKTRLIKQDAQQIRTPYITNGYNADNLIIDTKYNDNNTRVFNSNLIDIDNILNVNDIATPSTTSNIDTVSANNTEIINKFSIKKNSIDTKFSAFIDREYISNNSLNQDFIKGEGQYQFLDSNLYEEVAIDIELDTPVDTILQNTAYFQKASNAEIDPQSDAYDFNLTRENYQFNTWANSPYTFRKVNQQNKRLNTPFVIYNFSNNCWEYRGIPNPYQYYQSIYTSPTLNDNRTLLDYLPPTAIVSNDIKPFTSYFDKYLMSNLALTNNAINYLAFNTSIPGNINQIDELVSNLSLPTSQFGFPHFPKFYAFDENLLNMSKYLTKELIVDRISLNLNVDLQSEFDNQGSTQEDIHLTSGVNCSLNFFVVNQHELFNKAANNFLTVLPKGIATNNISLKPFKNVSNLINNFYENFPFQHRSMLYKEHLDEITNDNIEERVRIINRILIDENLIYNDLIDANYVKQKLILNENTKFNDDDKALQIEEFFSSDIITSKQREIITYGNINFYSKGINNNQDIDYEKVKNKIKANADAFINTDDFYTTPQNSSKHILDYSGNINCNTFIKKIAGVNELISNNTCGFSSHILNYQIELSDSLYDYYTYTTLNQGLSILQSDGLTRDILPISSSGRSLINNSSQYKLKKDIHEIISIEFDKNNNEKDGNVITKPFANWNKVNKSGNIELNKINNFSPYILRPNDNIYFALSISPTLSPKIFKQLLKIKQGKVKFTLHGYMQKNNVKVHEKNLQNLNQKNLSSIIIGNEDFVVNTYPNAYYSYSNLFNSYDRIYKGQFLSDFIGDTSQDITGSSNTFEPTINLGQLSYIFDNGIFNKNKTLIFKYTNTQNARKVILNIDLRYLQLEEGLQPSDLINDDGTGTYLCFENKSSNQTAFKIKVTDFNTGTEYWPLSDNGLDENVLAISQFEQFLLQWDIASQRFKRITSRQIMNSESLNFFTSKNIVSEGSKILLGNTFIPYLQLLNNNVLNDEFIYDDKETATFLGKSILQAEQDELIVTFDDYYAYTVVKEMGFYKNQKTKQQIQNFHDNDINNFLKAFLDGDKRYLNSYVNSKKYGQYNNFIEQRPYTTVKNATGKIDYVIEQNFINADTGIEITNLNNVMTRNKSKYLNLIDAGYKSITTDGVITPWNGADFYNRVHVSFNDSVS